jgi:hypothetical protein
MSPPRLPKSVDAGVPGARGVSRRAALHLGVGGVFGSIASRWLATQSAWGAEAAHTPPSPAKACIVLWLNGGPSHVDTFDPKPGRSGGGPFKAVATRAPGLSLCEHLPRLGDIADRLCVIRGMTSKEGNHQRAQYFVHTGYAPNPTVVHPSIGGWISARLGRPEDELPAFVSIGGPSQGAGFLGVQHGPFVLAKAGAPPADLAPPANVDAARFERRRALLDGFESRFAAQTADPKVDGRRQVYTQTFRLMQSPKTRAFDLADESAATVSSYGDSDFGRGCLLARRLVESGVRCVEVVLDGWDTHQNNFERTKVLMAALDPAFSALLRDLRERSLLGSTLVACMGEFGRTPRINGADGRDHHPQAWSAVLAGGGIRGGIVHGATDADGEQVASAPTRVPDLLATITSQLGIPPDLSLITPIGRPLTVTDGGRAMREILA